MAEESVLVFRVGEQIPESMRIVWRSERRLRVEQWRDKKKVYPLIYEDVLRLGYNALIDFEVTEEWRGAGGQCAGQCPIFEASGIPALIVPRDREDEAAALFRAIDDREEKLVNCNQRRPMTRTDFVMIAAGAVVIALVLWLVLFR
ncbi:hypothetical protein [Sutterella sp.]|uniref:hypothetical protein n=1 Tax=Sutterella sp. TaxID=1981025 RepID=UPI0026E10DA0|nr:hypothetical protein [Sutterella sp.]MDO5532278.1 hypothetical protein [Sutterella sp.]